MASSYICKRTLHLYLRNLSSKPQSSIQVCIAALYPKEKETNRLRVKMKYSSALLSLQLFLELGSLRKRRGAASLAPIIYGAAAVQVRIAQTGERTNQARRKSEEKIRGPPQKWTFLIGERKRRERKEREKRGKAHRPPRIFNGLRPSTEQACKNTRHIFHPAKSISLLTRITQARMQG